MSYTVVWKPEAHDELADIWSAADDRQSVSDALNKIDQLLKANPSEQGESRTGKLRILFVDPIGVIFDVNEQDRLVSVLRVWSL